MFIIYIAAMLGIFRFRGREYWKWVVILFAWMFGAQLLFAGGGTLDDPSGDGVIAHQIRIATNDGPGMGLFAIVFLIAYWGGAIWLIRKLYSVSKEVEQDHLQQEWDTEVTTATGRKLVEAAVLTLMTAIYVYFAFVAPSTTARTSAPVVNATPARSNAPDPISRELSNAADEVTRSGPKKLDPITTLVRASVKGRVFTYHYELSRRDVTDDELRKFARKNAVGLACNNPDMFHGIKDYGITYRYSYLLPNADAPVEIDANFKECQSLGLGH